MLGKGQLVLGVGVGTLKEEFDLLTAPLDDRGPRSDDALRALRIALSQLEPEYHGQFYEFAGMVVAPCAVQALVPIWVGGRTMRSLRRAISLADGWCPFGIPAAQARGWLATVELPFASEVVLPARPLDPIGEPGRKRHSRGYGFRRCHRRVHCLTEHDPGHSHRASRGPRYGARRDSLKCTVTRSRHRDEHNDTHAG